MTTTFSNKGAAVTTVSATILTASATTLVMGLTVANTGGAADTLTVSVVRAGGGGTRKIANAIPLPVGSTAVIAGGLMPKLNLVIGDVVNVILGTGTGDALMSILELT